MEKGFGTQTDFTLLHCKNSRNSQNATRRQNCPVPPTLLNLSHYWKLLSSTHCQSSLVVFFLIYIIFTPAWLCQQSSWNRNSSVVRLSVGSIISVPIAWISFKFWLLLPRAICPTVFRIFDFFFYEQFSGSITCDHMGANTLKRHSSIKSLTTFELLYLFTFSEFSCE